jgi:hypothetical protein
VLIRDDRPAPPRARPSDRLAIPGPGCHQAPQTLLACRPSTNIKWRRARIQHRKHHDQNQKDQNKQKSAVPLVAELVAAAIGSSRFVAAGDRRARVFLRRRIIRSATTEKAIKQCRQDGGRLNGGPGSQRPAWRLGQDSGRSQRDPND